MSSGPDAGLGEIRLPARQAGSSIMPGKVNPVIPEAVDAGGDAGVRQRLRDLGVACASGSLELNPFLPLVADCLLESLDVLARACDLFRRHAVEGIEADEAVCRAQVGNSTAVATALVPRLGYEGASSVVKQARESGMSIREVVLANGLMTEEQFEELISPEAVCCLGNPQAA